MGEVLGAEFTDREIGLAARAVKALQQARSKNEAINVVALIAKTVIEREPSAALYEWARESHREPR